VHENSDAEQYFGISAKNRSKVFTQVQNILHWYVETYEVRNCKLMGLGKGVLQDRYVREHPQKLRNLGCL
jgi:hypothetical protein